MKIIVGLGNPGSKYKNTRHNIGFMVVDKVAESQGFSDWEENKKLQALTCQGEIVGKKVLLAKPQTMMNNSGIAVKLLVTLPTGRQAGYSLPCLPAGRLVTNTWIVHDEIDLPLGSLRIVKDRGSAGHKGVESIINHLETNDFVRFRVGIKSRDPHQQPETQREVSNFVLSPFRPEEENLKKKALEKAEKAISLALREGIEKAMERFD